MWNLQDLFGRGVFHQNLVFENQVLDDPVFVSLALAGSRLVLARSGNRVPRLLCRGEGLDDRLVLVHISHQVLAVQEASQDRVLVLAFEEVLEEELSL